MVRNTVTMALGIMLLVSARAEAQHSCVHEDTLASHVGHVMWCWDDTPYNRGLLVTAMVEGAVAQRYAEFAVADSHDVEALRRYLGYVIHALDPSIEPEGEGLDYGLILAAEGASVHIGFALQAESMFGSDGSSGDGSYGTSDSGNNGSQGAGTDAIDAALDNMFDESAVHDVSDFVHAQAGHANQSLTNASAWASEALALALAARAQPDAARAAAEAQSVLAAIQAVMGGRDLDGDGKIAPEAGEGGLNQAHDAMMAIIGDQQLTAPLAPSESE